MGLAWDSHVVDFRKCGPRSQSLHTKTSYGILDWGKHSDPSLSPKVPGVDHIQETIAGTNNSCAGPDGIPFIAYRIFSHVAAPILQRCLAFLADGGLPPPDYNWARLFLIPKNDTLNPLDNRPISVTNADNRILAFSLVNALLPSLSDVIHEAQTGFVRGRDPTSNIRSLNEGFYSSLSKKEQMYVLFLDTKKAFDSIDHDFIIAVLNQLGLPPWVSRVVGGLWKAGVATPYP